MPNRACLLDASFGPEQINMMAQALDSALGSLRLTDRSDPIVANVAKRIIRLAQQGDPDGATIAQQVIAEFQVHAFISHSKRAVA